MKPPLPAEVIEALEAGQTIEAIKRLRQTTGLGLKEAKDAVEAQLRSASTAAPPLPVTTAAAGGELPPQVLHALQQGNKIDAIRLMREHTGLGLKEAKEQVEAAQVSPSTQSGLAPGEVPRRPGLGLWAVVLALVAALVYYLVRSGG